MSTNIWINFPGKRKLTEAVREIKTWNVDLQSTRTFRYAVGVTTATAISFSFNWPLHFITPLFASIYLSLPMPAPTIRKVINMFIHLLIAFSLGIVFTLFLMPYPLVFIPALGLVMFHIYYFANRGGSVFFALMTLISAVILPMMGTLHHVLSHEIVFYFVFSYMLALIIYITAHVLIPDPLSESSVTDHGRFEPGYSRDAALSAWKSTIAVLPIFVLFVTMGWSDHFVMITYSCVLILTPQLSKGTVVGLKLLKSNLIGGVSFMIFYGLIVAVPSYLFSIALILLTTLIFGKGIFSDHHYSKYLTCAMSAFFILVGGSLGEGANFADKLITRVLLIGGAMIYVVGVMSILDCYLPTGFSQSMEKKPSG